MTPVDLHMAEWNCPAAPLDPARPARNPDDGAMERLRNLHGEAGRNLALAQFVARVPAACVVLMLTGALALIWAAAAGGAGLKAAFAWAALVLLGIVAMIRLHIRGFARSLRRLPDHARSARAGPGLLLCRPAQPGRRPDLARCAGFCRFRRAILGAGRRRHALGRLASRYVGSQRHHGVARNLEFGICLAHGADAAPVAAPAPSLMGTRRPICHRIVIVACLDNMPSFERGQP
jgi:hypothetical protein